MSISAIKNLILVYGVEAFWGFQKNLSQRCHKSVLIMNCVARSEEDFSLSPSTNYRHTN